MFDTTLREYQAGNMGALMAVESYVGLMTVQSKRLAAEFGAANQNHQHLFV